jgi:DNA-binding NtrC family response regulator
MAERMNAGLHAPSLDSMPGRKGEIARLEESLAQAIQTRTCRVLSVTGPAGVGRTSLLDGLAEKLSSGGAWLVQSQASRARCPPLSFIKPVAQRGVERLSPLIPSETLRELTRALAPVLGGGAAGLPSALKGAVADVVLRAGRDVPFVLLLDDVDAADAASLSILAHLLSVLTAPGATRSPEETFAGGLVVLGARDGAWSSEVEACLSPWPSVALAPLDLEGVRSYLSQSDAARRAYELTGGVPGRLADLFEGGEPVDLAARRLERLPLADLAVLKALSVIAQPVDAELVALVSGRPDADARLARLASARTIQAQPGTRKSLYSLARESDRRALLESFSAAELRGQHEAAGRAFEAARDEASAFEHFAAVPDAARASSVGFAAAKQLMHRHSWEAADELLSRLVRLGIEPRQRSSAWMLLAEVREQRAEHRSALAALGNARRFGSEAERRLLRGRSARLCLLLGAPKPAERLARRVLDESADAPGAADAWIALAEARFLRGAYEEALALTQTAGLPIEHQLVLGNVRGKALLTLGRLDEAHDAFQSNAISADRAGVVVEHARGLLNVGVVAHRRGAREQARAAYRSSLAASSEHPFAAVAHANLSSLALEDGEAAEALAQGHRALSAFVREGRAKEQAHATQNLARVYLYLGDFERARELALHAGALALRVGDPYLQTGARLVAAEVKLARGEDASSALHAVATEFASLGNPRYQRESLLLLAQSKLAQGDAPAAHAVLIEAQAAGVLQVPALAAEWHLLTAQAALADGQTDAAASALSDARSALVASPQLELPARLYLLAGEVAERRGDASLAQADRLRAVRIVEELANRVPAERRALFLARSSRRGVLDAAGRVWPMTPTAPPSERIEVVARPAGSLVGQAPAMARLNALLARLGPTTTTVLLRGESGTGKELAAKALHSNSPRRDLPLVSVNCGALSEELLLSELFGHEKGAFTGAIRERKGRFELADGGTIFLDEIGDISARAQVALLRVLQERTFERVGGTRTLHVDVRIICATNRNLEELMTKGQFREDLYYRLRGASLTLPALRERLEDLPALGEHLFARYAQEHQEPVRELSPESRRMLAAYRWPGNVRELFNVLESALVMSSARTIGPEAFELFPELFDAVARPRSERLVTEGLSGATSAEGVDFYALLKGRDLSLKDLRRELDVVCIARALVEGNGNISEAARLLKTKRSRLSQVVNAEPELRALCRGVVPGGGSADDLDD